MCEDSSTKNPKKLHQRIDALKHLYNNLGENVTESKKQLEYLTKLTKQLNEYFDLIEKYLHEKQLTQFSIETNSDDDLELGNVRNAIVKCNDIYKEYASVCDVNYLGDLKDRIEILTCRLDRSIRRDADMEDVKLLHEMKSNLQNMNNITTTKLS